MSDASLALPLGSRVVVAAGNGTIKFSGSTAFAAGKWVGVELDEPHGKNNGTIAGKRYFACGEACGVFVRPSQIKLLLGAQPSELDVSAVVVTKRTSW